MMIIGVDYHPSFQTIAFLMEETGECGEQELNHSDGQAERFYRDLQQRGMRGRAEHRSVADAKFLHTFDATNTGSQITAEKTAVGRFVCEPAHSAKTGIISSRRTTASRMASLAKWPSLRRSWVRIWSTFIEFPARIPSRACRLDFTIFSKPIFPLCCPSCHNRFEEA
jgi:hypothetical protein